MTAILTEISIDTGRMAGVRSTTDQATIGLMVMTDSTATVSDAAPVTAATTMTDVMATETTTIRTGNTVISAIDTVLTG